jgi:hypothetical protein
MAGVASRWPLRQRRFAEGSHDLALASLSALGQQGLELVDGLAGVADRQVLDHPQAEFAQQPGSQVQLQAVGDVADSSSLAVRAFSVDAAGLAMTVVSSVRLVAAWAAAWAAGWATVWSIASSVDWTGT